MWKSTLLCLDDWIIFCLTAEEPIERLREVFQRFKDAYLKINALKWEFFRQHVLSFCHILCRVEFQADPAKTLAVCKYPVRNQLLWWKVGTLFLLVLHPLTEKTKELHWISEARQPCEHLKNISTLSPILAFLSMKEPFILYIDENEFAIGTVFAREQNILEWVVCYASKPLSKAQIYYSTTEWELLPKIIYTRHFKHYLLGRQFEITTDHRRLQWLHNVNNPDAITACWLKKLTGFDYEIEHSSGKSIGYADCMSRFRAAVAALNMTTIMEFDTSFDGQSTPPRNIFLLQTVKLNQHNHWIAPLYHGTLVKSMRGKMSSLTSRKGTKPEQTNRLMLSSLKSESSTNPEQRKPIRRKMRNLTTETASQPKKTQAIRLMMRSLKCNTATKLVQAKHYHIFQ